MQQLNDIIERYESLLKQDEMTPQQFYEATNINLYDVCKGLNICDLDNTIGDVLYRRIESRLYFDKTPQRIFILLGGNHEMNIQAMDVLNRYMELDLTNTFQIPEKLPNNLRTLLDQNIGEPILYIPQFHQLMKHKRMKKVSTSRILSNQFKAIEVNKKTFNLTGYEGYLTLTSDVLYIADENIKSLHQFIEVVNSRKEDKDVDVQQLLDDNDVTIYIFTEGSYKRYQGEGPGTLKLD